MVNQERDGSPACAARERRFLNEVIIVRLVLIVCLVLYHSFAPYAGSWLPLSEDVILPYYWVAKFSYSFFLGSFVFISGYLYAYADMIKGPQPLRVVVKKKGMRLLIPSIIFSALYLAILGLNDGETTRHAIYTLFSGRGHLWFLPMLFWLFIAMEFIKWTKLKPKVVLPIAFILSIGGLFPFPLLFRLDGAFKYFIFFYLGYIIKNYGFDQKKIEQGKWLITSLIVWITTFVCVEWIVLKIYNPYGEGAHFWVWDFLIYYGQILYTIAGTIFVYGLSLRMMNEWKIKISPALVKLSGLCFGIYLYQEFILMLLYYHTDYVGHVGLWWAPWLAFAATLLVSTALSYLTMKTRFGRALIG